MQGMPEAFQSNYFCGETHCEQTPGARETARRGEHGNHVLIVTQFVNFIQLPYFNNFALDPHRIQPFSHPPPPVGNSQAPPPQAYGLQGPAYPPAGDYGRPPPHYGSYYPPPYVNGAPYHDPYGYPYPPAAYPPPQLPRRDEPVGRRLSDRLGGFAPVQDYGSESVAPAPASAGLPAKPMAALESLPVPTGRMNNRTGPPPPPPDAKEDPRAAAGKKVSYHDMDLVAEGDVELTY